MTYKEICKSMLAAGWGSHAVLCAKLVKDPHFHRRGSGFCTVGNIKLLDTYTLFTQRGRVPDHSEWVGEPARMEWLSPKSGGGTQAFRCKAWIYRDKGLVGFINPEGKHLLCALSDVESSLKS